MNIVNFNQFGCDRSVEFPQPPQSVPLWTEHYMFFGFDPQEGIGFFLHIGREQFDKSMWRINVMVYLPHEELLVAKYRGRDGHARGPGAGPVRISCVEPFRHWTVEFDGAAQAVSRAANNREVLRDGPAEPLRFHVSLEGAAPFWDYRALRSNIMEKQSWGSQHYEQICRFIGDISYRGRTVQLQGSGIRDHSPGPRDYAPVISDFWINGLFPDGKAFNASLVRSESHGSEIRYAYFVEATGKPIELVEQISGPALNTLDTPAASVPSDIMSEGLRTFKVVLRTPKGLETIDGEILHSVATTYVSPSEELIGTDFTRPQALQLLTCPARFRRGDAVGYGIRERIARIQTLR